MALAIGCSLALSIAPATRSTVGRSAAAKAPSNLGGAGTYNSADPAQGAVSLAWTDNATNETRYSIERSSDNSHWSEIASLPAGSTRYTDTGLTLNYLIRYLRGKAPSSLRICTLLDKPARRLVEIPVDYTGFTIPDQFVVGYGLDYGELYRNLRYVGVLKPEVYSEVRAEADGE
jgi:hypothetical protein